jgi:hypothetical protein
MAPLLAVKDYGGHNHLGRILEEIRAEL